MIDVYVLVSPGSNRSEDLLRNLRSNSEVTVHLIASTMTPTFSEVTKKCKPFNLNYASLYIGRRILPAEIGCSFTHNHARKLISEKGNGGIVLEDDAIIGDFESMLHCARQFLAINNERKRIISLHNPSEKVFRIQKSTTDYSPLFGKPKIAVAYALTSTAAKELVQSNNPIRYVADWPESKCRFYVSRINYVKHDSTALSTIVEKGNELRSVNHSRFKYLLNLVKEKKFQSRDLLNLPRIFLLVVMNYLRTKIDVALYHKL